MPDVSDLPAGVSVEAWLADRPPRKLVDWRRAGESGHGIVWVDLEEATDADAVADAIDEMKLPGYERSMLGFVLQGVDPHSFGAEQVRWYDKQIARQLSLLGQPRFLTAFALGAQISPGLSEPPWVLVQPVQFLVGGRWIITNRAKGRASDGLSTEIGAAFPRSQLRGYATRRWKRFVHPGDLAVLFLRSLVETYRPALADLDRRLQDLQQAYVRGRDDLEGGENLDETKYRAGLLQVKWVVDRVSRSLVQLARPATDARTAWFDLQENVGPATETAELVDRADRALARQRDELRESFALIAASQASEQLAIAREIQETTAEAEERARDFQVVAQFAAAAFLAPALVAAIFGALRDSRGLSFATGDPGLWDHPACRCRFILRASALSRTKA